MPQLDAVRPSVVTLVIDRAGKALGRCEHEFAVTARR